MATEDLRWSRHPSLRADPFSLSSDGRFALHFVRDRVPQRQREENVCFKVGKEGIGAEDLVLWLPGIRWLITSYYPFCKAGVFGGLGTLFT